MQGGVVLSSFHGPLFIPLFLFLVSLLALCSSPFLLKRIYWRGPGGDGCVIRASNVANYSRVLGTCGSATGDQRRVSNHQRVFTTSQRTLCIRCLFAKRLYLSLSVFSWMKSRLFLSLSRRIKPSENSGACDNRTSLRGNGDTLTGPLRRR